MLCVLLTMLLGISTFPILDFFYQQSVLELIISYAFRNIYIIPILVFYVVNFWIRFALNYILYLLYYLIYCVYYIMGLSLTFDFLFVFVCMLYFNLPIKLLSSSINNSNSYFKCYIFIIETFKLLI